MRIRTQNVFVTLALTVCIGFLPFGRIKAQTFTNLHSLVYTNGTYPYAGLVLAGNILYGTAANGGSPASGSAAGTIFKMNIDGSGFTNMYSFNQGTNGGNPYGGVILAGSMLYGAAEFGGTSNSGCIFGISTNGTGFTNFFNFPALQPHSPFDTNQSGAYPGSSLAVSGGTLYGSAGQGGGEYSWGTLFSVNTNGSAFTNLHNFNVSDGQYPNALTLAGNVLFGSAPDGGTNNMGIIFMLNTNGSGFTDLYSFSPPLGFPYTNADGATPIGNLLVSGGMIYGTAFGGGSNGCGTIFAIATNGTGFTVLHEFSATNAAGINGDGGHPYAGLIMWNNRLYGTAVDGGSAGYGTVFSLKTDGTAFTVLHSFTSTNNVGGTNTDGAYPRGVLVASGSALYGTASAGGTAAFGTIFSIALPPPLNIALAGTNAIVSWSTNFNGYSLESTTNLAVPSWITISGQYSVTNPVSGKQKYFRLMHP